ncbi:uncharacterized protein LOC119608723 [Lucilia sericata]|uniref:uncharacterized protein LOC119608723 n=1 Tax=Lucilia sericata TaxID=13632 RepID=UPI0018A80A3C|nr:uncharacterized protein LOC119608723 [Lucilia sericata]
MSNTNPLNVTVNSTMATLINQTVTVLNLNTTQSTPFINSTWIPYNDSSVYPNVNSSTNGYLPWYWNNSVYNPPVYTPYCPDCYPNYVTIDPPLITYSYTYSYAYYVLLLLLLIVAIICIKIGISRRKELERRAAAQRRRALQQSQNAYIVTSDNSNNNNNNSPDTEAKEFDLPPAYNEVVQSYILAKQQQQEQSGENSTTDVASGMTTNPSTNTISTAISTLTIDTEISNSNYASAVNLNIPSTSSIMTETTVISNPPANRSAIAAAAASASSPPPSYDHLEIEMSSTKINNDHIV